MARANHVTVVGIGASAGGIEAFREFFEHTPRDTGLAFVVVLHLPPDRKSLLSEILGRWTTMPVIDAVEGCPVEPNHVYVPPPGRTVIFRAGHLHLYESAPRAARDPNPIDAFFDSLARELNEDAVGVVLSGTGNDGALGLKAIRTRGGLTLAQGTDGSAPQHVGMPDSAIATGAVDLVAPVETMARHIIAIQKSRLEPSEPLSEADVEHARMEICEVLHKQLGHDFSGYKDKTFLRRVYRQMQMLGVASVRDYIERLRGQPQDVIRLFNDLLIGVTSFFRDPETFGTLRTTVLPRIFAGRLDNIVRVWVPGCATGEEAYSLAILMLEFADQFGEDAPGIQIFATDIDEAAIATARGGRYPSSLLEGVERERLERFFVAGPDGGHTVAKAVRAVCTFSAHSVTRDPPFSRIDLVSCRNLLIYLNTDLQASVIPAFHYSLVPDGVLLLGSSETITRHEGLFDPIDKHHRIFKKRNVTSPPLRMTGRSGGGSINSARAEARKPMEASVIQSKFRNRASARVLENFAPVHVVVTSIGDIIQFSSRSGRYFEAPAGSPSQNMLVMARHGLAVHLRSTLKRAVETGHPAEKLDVSINLSDDEAKRVDILIEPMPEQSASTLYLVVFLERSSQKPAAEAGSAPLGARTEVDGAAGRDLENELRDAREQLQSITEEHDTALEELRSANEELHSVNEELQSTNEELETSKEEIQSINEELQTLNGQLGSKVDELDHKNADLRNLFDSTQVATIFLDPYLVVRGFTPAVASIYNLIPSDVGRPLTDIVSRVDYKSLREDVPSVLKSCEPLERRVARDDDGTYYLMRILPYRTNESAVDGTIITFVDVTNIVKAEQHQRLLVDELNHRVKNMLTVIISMASQTIRRSASLDEFSRTFLGRVHALSAAYSLLSAQAWQTVRLRDLLLEELKPFQATDRENFILEGPTTRLEPRAALALGMAIHELTTNAVKYGALSVPEGTIKVSWRVEPSDGRAMLRLEWLELDGPAVTAPTQRGFGMSLIERGLKQDMAAQVDVEFASAGVKATVHAPLGEGIE